MVAKLIVGTALFLFGVGGINWLVTTYPVCAKTEVAVVEAMSVQSEAQSSDTPQNKQYVVDGYAVILCLNGADVTVDKTDPVFVVSCE